MTTSQLGLLITQLLGIGQVAIVGQRDTKGRVDVEGLCLSGTGTTGRRIAYMTYAHVALETLHVPCLEHILDQAIGFALFKIPISYGHNACRILTTMLQYGQRIIQGLINRGGSHYTDDTTHVLVTSRSLVTN